MLVVSELGIGRIVGDHTGRELLPRPRSLRGECAGGVFGGLELACLAVRLVSSPISAINASSDPRVYGLTAGSLGTSGCIMATASVLTTLGSDQPSMGGLAFPTGPRS